MKLQRNFQVNPALVGIVPLINVMFLVILFFALSSRFLLQPGLAVSLPTSSFVLTPAREPQLVSISTAPVLSMYHGDRRVTLEELATSLGAVEGKERSLVIKADRATPYDLIVNVMNVGLSHGYSIVLATAREAREPR